MKDWKMERSLGQSFSSTKETSSLYLPLARKLFPPHEPGSRRHCGCPCFSVVAVVVEPSSRFKIGGERKNEKCVHLIGVDFLPCCIG